MTFNEFRKSYFEEYEGTEGGAATHLLESAISYARGIQGPGFPPARSGRLEVGDTRVRFADECERLLKWAEGSGIPVQYIDSELGTQHAEGTEHWVWYEDTRVRRVSFDSGEFNSQGPYGQTIESFEQLDFQSKTVRLIENRKASPSEYLERLYLQNLLFNIDNRLVAVHSNGITSSQPLFTGDIVSKESLSRLLGQFGFRQVSSLTWYSADLEIAISDVAFHNVIGSDGVIFPFDIWARRLILD